MLMHWRPYNELARWSRELDELFQGERDNGGMVFRPPVDIEETEDSFVLHADLPGVNEQDIEVKVDDGKLLLSGKRETRSDEENHNGTYRERRFGSFFRQFSLGPNVDPSTIKATYKNGVLSVTLPKKPESKPHQIKVSTN